jgi:hypothetical protein
MLHQVDAYVLNKSWFGRVKSAELPESTTQPFFI